MYENSMMVDILSWVAVSSFIVFLCGSAALRLCEEYFRSLALRFDSRKEQEMNSKIILAAACLLSAGCSLAKPAKTEMRHLKPMEFVKDMGAGWNLGNALDSKGPDETAWGNPRITKRLIDAVACL